MGAQRGKILVVVIGIVLSITLSSCRAYEKGDLRITDIEIFKDTPAWELALAVKRQSTKSIEKTIRTNPGLLNFQEPHFGATLLLWSVGMEKYNSAKKLLELGADPDIASTYDGTTPLFQASGFSWVSVAWFPNEDPKYVKLLLQYGADPNTTFKGHNKPGINNIVERGTSALMHSVGAGLEKTKALVKGGADLNYKTVTGRTAAVRALFWGEPKYAYYLIAECKARVTEPIWAREEWTRANNAPVYPVELLRDWVFKIGSKEHQMKMEIVEEFKRQGVDYWGTEVPKSRFEQIKKLYPDTWEEYIQKY